jgi:hypothetical protein
MKISEAIELTTVVIPFHKKDAKGEDVLVNGKPVIVGRVTCRLSAERLTLDLMDDMQGLKGENPDVKVLADTAASVIAEWDLQEDDGSIVPLTPERLRNLHMGVLSKVITAIFEAINPTTEEVAS